MTEELDLARIIRQDVIPLTITYVLFLVAMARHMRRRRGPVRLEVPAGVAGRGLRPLARYLVATALGGYLVFLAILLVFYLLLGASTLDFAIKGAVRGAGLAVVAVILFLAIAMAYRATGNRRRREPTER